MSGAAMDRVLLSFQAQTGAEQRKKLALLAVASASIDGHTAHPGMAAIALRACCTRGTAIRLVAALVEDGRLEVLEMGGGRGRAAVLRIIWPEETPSENCAIPAPILRDSNEKLRDSSANTARFSEKLRDSSVETEAPHILLIKEKRDNDVNNDELASVSDLHPGQMFSLPDLVQRVFNVWVQATGRTNRTVLDSTRRRLIEKWLAWYPVEDLEDACRGWQNDPFNCGDNDRGKTYNDLGLLLRDADHIEKYRDLWRAGPMKKSEPDLNDWSHEPGLRTEDGWL